MFFCALDGRKHDPQNAKDGGEDDHRSCYYPKHLHGRRPIPTDCYQIEQCGSGYHPRGGKIKIGQKYVADNANRFFHVLLPHPLAVARIVLTLSP